MTLSVHDHILIAVARKPRTSAKIVKIVSKATSKPRRIIWRTIIKMMEEEKIRYRDDGADYTGGAEKLRKALSCLSHGYDKRANELLADILSQH
jgi:hypothetical protein